MNKTAVAAVKAASESDPAIYGPARDEYEASTDDQKDARAAVMASAMGPVAKLVLLGCDADVEQISELAESLLAIREADLVMYSEPEA